MRRGLEELTWNVWMRADRDGVLELPDRVSVEVPDLREACDLIGFSYYSALGVDRRGQHRAYPPDARNGPMGYAPWSEGLGIVLHRLHDELPGRPLLICEHGIGTDDDAWRCDVLRESLALVEDAIADGVDLRGFFHWTGVDNYEWIYGFDVQFGLFNRDREPRGWPTSYGHTLRRLDVGALEAHRLGNEEDEDEQRRAEEAGEPRLDSRGEETSRIEAGGWRRGPGPGQLR